MYLRVGGCVKPELGFCPEGPYADPSWQAQLDVLNPPNGKLSWLHLYWEAGFPWEHVGRWMIGQVMPPERVPDVFRELLEGPNPANFGRLVNGKWLSLLPGISRRQWHFYRNTGCLLKPYWVVQGSRGGHKLRLTHAESRIIELNGGDPDPPAVGDLPYAAPDSRTFQKLAQLDMVRQYAFMVDFLENGDERLSAQDKNGLVAMRKLLWETWLEPMAAEWGDEIAFHTRGNDGPPAEDMTEKIEEAEQSFIYEGA